MSQKLLFRSRYVLALAFLRQQGDKGSDIKVGKRRETNPEKMRKNKKVRQNWLQSFEPQQPQCVQ